MRYLILDLDQTIGDFGDVANYVNSVESVLGRQASVKELFQIFTSFSECFCTPIIRLIKEIYIRKAADGDYRIVMYTNNMGPKSWALGIALFLEWLLQQCITRYTDVALRHACLPLVTLSEHLDQPREQICMLYDRYMMSHGNKKYLTVFDAVLGLHKLPAGAVNEPLRTTNEKTFDDLSLALQKLDMLVRPNKMMFVDDQLHPHMVVPGKVLYYKIDAYAVTFSAMHVLTRISRLVLKFQRRDCVESECRVAFGGRPAQTTDEGEEHETLASLMLLQTLGDVDMDAWGSYMASRSEQRVCLSDAAYSFVT